MSRISAYDASTQLEVVTWRRSHTPVIGKKRIIEDIGIGFTMLGMAKKLREVAKVMSIVPIALIQRI